MANMGVNLMTADNRGISPAKNASINGKTVTLKVLKEFRTLEKEDSLSENALIENRDTKVTVEQVGMAEPIDNMEPRGPMERIRIWLGNLRERRLTHSQNYCR